MITQRLLPPFRWGLGAVALLLGGCEVLYPIPRTGDSTESGVVTFEQVHQSIIAVNCAVAGCHVVGGDAPMSLRAIDAYDNLVNVPSIGVPTMDRIEPGSVDQSYLWHKINENAGNVGATGIQAQRMPPRGLPLSADEITLIEEWILGGALRDADVTP